jgi:archaellum component FlaC
MQTIPVSIPYPELQSTMNEDLDDSSQKPILKHDLRLFSSRVNAEFNKLRTAIIQGFDQTYRRFDSIDSRFNASDTRFNSIDTRFDSIDKRFNSIDDRLDSVSSRLDSVDTRLNSMDVKMGGFEKQFELIQLQFAGVHTRFDDLMSHRNRDSIATLLGFVAVVVAIFWKGR